jgi:hypothetical protein
VIHVLTSIGYSQLSDFETVAHRPREVRVDEENRVREEVAAS